MAPVWAEVSFEVSAGDVELASFLAREATGAGIQVEEPVEVLGPEEGYRVLAERPVALRLYLPVLDDLGARLEVLRAALDTLEGPPEMTTRPVQEEDWAEAWKQFYDVIHVGRRTVIKPSWKEYDARPGDVVVELDPGQAFGTGQHETTRLCLELLEAAVAAGHRVLDAGCGSGILAIAAAKLGATEVLAADIDPVCVRVARENVSQNGLSDRITCLEGTLDEHFVDAHASRFDVVAANIIADVLIRYAEALAAVTRPGGRLIASGIILEREPHTLAALEGAGSRLLEARREGNWAALLLERL
jgi:ribosomal protein L11 methyltransferase